MRVYDLNDVPVYYYPNPPSQYPVPAPLIGNISSIDVEGDHYIAIIKTKLYGTDSMEQVIIIKHLKAEKGLAILLKEFKLSIADLELLVGKDVVLEYTGHPRNRFWAIKRPSERLRLITDAAIEAWSARELMPKSVSQY